MALNDFNLKYNEPMSLHTTFRTGGTSDMFFEPSSAEELAAVIAAARAEDVPTMIIGNGSNLLVRDGGIRGLVIKLGRRMSEISVSGDTLDAQGGALMSAVAAAAMSAGLGGFEFASGIPGSIGGGLYMNAGAYGGEIADVVTEAEYIADDMVKIIKKKDMQLAYRSSIFEKQGGIITRVTLRLYQSDKQVIADKTADLRKRRIEKQPLEFASAGSTFKRPEGHFAGALIEQAGLKGARIGDAEVSQKHAGFIINRGSASSADILKLIEFVQNKVFENSGIKLVPEVRIIGEE